ncbi:pyridoxal 5'-phosphate synthase glutaminase subunit PdxT [Corynebacterium sp. 153RC1]|uniref:pyridoxal 5'-phosphate synthase glutaminase subunit PdxT n=1 Tax=unclassified Corynebacterium TaxID=2624378 RepID=UPI00211C349D|nr:MULTISPECIES: pyridoxal 5'-phosphate synthase glutaminase subunit PdxT [unclassified Corynebacterium]MCQ9353449.1 pyridoxal 5'-phosphate synthase glutaminase subunit PdxT [Corynebacterium sp. 209RC1]MCQ9355115.1 pyridoxal 5'-phosphate synthase glutaminase subunit PdxT [Corynebacterium sp. 1222RC1]MCQ9357477.1 pyridoxal 5'-phosphate synthase glutaminase subunit PdxT [Corynebacterium sp. 122RC1]MCQ9359856.1 pyridoxal 5'-phosphate synthase glutaminase subunit PdxT [Corynebacterium sp. 142RC1]M
MRIGILALQGGVEEHQAMLERLDADVVRVRRPHELEGLDGVVIPGGESSVMDRLARTFGLANPLMNAIAAGLPVMGTCAGLIYLAKEVHGLAPGQQTLGALDITVARNSFGNQQDSFETSLDVGPVKDFPAVFIRAPKVLGIGGEVAVVATLPDATIVGVRSGNLLGLSFHPESTPDVRVHQWWLEEFVGVRG